MLLALVSDAHGARRWMDALLNALPAVDAVCFLGDMDDDAEYLRYGMEEKQPKAAFYRVAGNNDPFSELPRTLEMTFEDCRLLLTHGHLYRGIRSSRTTLAEHAGRRGCQLVLYGHTHVRRDESIAGVRLINPGALMRAQYALLSVEHGTASALFLSLGEAAGSTG